MIDPAFLSVTLDGHAFDFSFWKPTSQITQLLAKNLAPAYIRFGGGSHSILTYNMTDHFLPIPPQPTIYPPPLPTVYMNRSQWDELNNFCNKVGWYNVFALNGIQRIKDESADYGSRWDSTAAKDLIKYSVIHNYNISWELGNEPDLYRHIFNLSDHSIFPIPPAQMVRDHHSLRKLINNIYNSSGVAFPLISLIGPDVANAGVAGGQLYWKEYFGNQTNKIQGITQASWHHYYGNGRTAKITDTFSTGVLDKFLTQQLEMAHILDQQTTRTGLKVPIWLGETSSFYGGGAINISDRYAASFLWLDKLGLSARMNISVVCRQAWMGAHYSLIEYTTFLPLPDYWISVLHKRLVGVRVLDVKGSLSTGRVVRIYAHCTADWALRSFGYPIGAITLIVLNTNDTHPATVRIIDSNGIDLLANSKSWDQYSITPSGPEGISSKYIELNGKKLVITYDSAGVPQFPALNPKIQKQKRVITLPPLTFGFYVIPNAQASGCTS